MQLSMMSLVEQSKTALPVSSVALRHTIDLKPEIPKPKPEIPVMTHTFVPINAQFESHYLSLPFHPHQNIDNMLSCFGAHSRQVPSFNVWGTVG